MSSPGSGSFCHHITGQHLGDFFHPFLKGQQTDLGNRGRFIRNFLNKELMVRNSNDLGQVGNSQDLTKLANLVNFLNDDLGYTARHTRIHLVKDDTGLALLTGKG